MDLAKSVKYIDDNEKLISFFGKVIFSEEKVDPIIKKKDLFITLKGEKPDVGIREFNFSYFNYVPIIGDKLKIYHPTNIKNRVFAYELISEDNNAKLRGIQDKLYFEED